MGASGSQCARSGISSSSPGVVHEFGVAGEGAEVGGDLLVALLQFRETGADAGAERAGGSVVAGGGFQFGDQVVLGADDAGQFAFQGLPLPLPLGAGVGADLGCRLRA